jgi:hypothetical protein
MSPNVARSCSEVSRIAQLPASEHLSLNPTPNQAGLSVLAVRDCLINTLSSTTHIGRMTPPYTRTASAMSL